MVRLFFQEEKCTACRQCIEKCPFGALELKDGKIEVNSNCRMCKLCVRTCPEQAIELREETPVRTVDKGAWRGILVFAEQDAAGVHPVTFELIGKARELAAEIHHPVYCVLIGDEAAAAHARLLLEYGVDAVYIYAYDQLANFRNDVYTNVMADCIERVKPAVVLVGATAMGRCLAPACAIRFRTGLTADCTALEMKDNTDLVQIRPAFGGNIMAQIVTPNTRPQFATVRYKVMDAPAKAAPHGRAVRCEVSEEMLRSDIEVISSERIQRAKKSIEDEEILVVAGRGVKKREDLEMLHELAAVLGGQLAITRPLAEKGWGDVTTQIGMSGRTVKPKLIITCGVSGAVQFTAGMEDSECVVSINTDPNAPIFKIAHYCITDSLYTVVPPLIESVRAKRTQCEER